MEHKYDDTFLARWLAGELPEEELSAFEKSTEYSEYKKIIEGADRLEAPSFDRQKVFNAIKHQTKQETKVRKLIPNWAYAAAAAVVIFYFGFTFFFNQTTFETANQEQIVFDLPDGSQVNLNAGSKIAFNERNWENERTLNLEGEAFFKVKKGSKFTVKTKEGEVSVLGTQFTVNSRNNYYDVICFEGKVKVETTGNEHILTKGKAVRLYNNNTQEYNVSGDMPSWMNKESSFNNAPIVIVMEELERQFGIQIANKQSLKNELFSGRFNHANLEQALKTVFVAMDIPYTFDGDKQVTIEVY